MKRLLSILLLSVLVLTLSACGNNNITFQFLGDDYQTYSVNTAYSEKGFIAKDGSTDISQYVSVVGNINPTISGDYEVTYTLDYKGETTTITKHVFYREEGCTVDVKAIENDPTAEYVTACTTVWSEYLHTVVKLTVYYEGSEFNDKTIYLFDNVENMLRKYNNLSDKYESYAGYFNVKDINDNPSQTHTLQKELFDLIKFTVDHQGEVDYLFNLALGPVLKIWHNYREECNTDAVCALPTEAELQAANAFTDPNKIVLDEENRTITMEENMAIDLGGVSKGYISGKIIEYLDTQNLRGYLLNNGTSNISIGGIHPNRETEEFVLAVTDPDNQYGGYYATVNLRDGDQLVTSGDYQQFFTVDGTLYHHIINPNTLMPERYSRSVSIVTDDPALADLYSTAIFNMTIADGIKFVDSIDNLEAIWYDVDGKIHFSKNFESEYLRALN